MSNKSRYAWFSEVEPDNIVTPMEVPDFSESLKVLDITNPTDPVTGFPVSDLSLYFRDNVSPDVKDLIARNLQRLGSNVDTSNLTDEQLMSVLPSRYAQSYGEVEQWRETLSNFMRSDYQRIIDNAQVAAPPTSNVDPTGAAAPPAAATGE